jgi:DNA-binding LacI/PurR family transcriptional regulator
VNSLSVTIKDVAKRANVSPSTVSRVISNSHEISEKTKKKVRKVMEELGYHINYNARVLVQQSTKTIGIVMKASQSTSVKDPFFQEVINGISAFCSSHDYSISLASGETEEAIFQDTVKMVQGKRVDGVIVLYSKKDDRIVPYLYEKDIPFVVLGKPFLQANKIMSVDNDNVQAAKEATEYLINLGHERIAFIDSVEQAEVGESRLNGFRLAMSMNDPEVMQEYVRCIPFDNVKSKAVIKELMNLPKRPTAFVVTGDILSLIVLSALQEQEMKVPDDVSIVSFNNSVIADFSNPPLTSIDIRTYQLGFESAKSLIEGLNDPANFSKSVIIPTVIVERESCAPPNKVINSEMTAQE